MQILFALLITIVASFQPHGMLSGAGAERMETHVAGVPDSLVTRMEQMADKGEYFYALDAAELVMLAAEQEDDSVRYAAAMARHAKFLSYIGRLDEALNEGSWLCDYHLRHDGPLSAPYATALLDQAGYNSRSGHYAEAIRLGEAVVPLRRKLFGENSVEYAQALNHLSKYLSYADQFTRAIQLEERAIEIRTALVGTENEVHAQMLSNLAGYHSRRGDYDEAISYGTEAMQLRGRLLGTQHPDYAQSLNHLARYYSYKSDFQHMLDYGQQAVDLRRQLYGEMHPETAQSISNLAGYYSRMGNYDEAIRLGTEALNIRRHIMSTAHPDYAQSVNNLAKYYYFKGDYAGAIDYGQQALDLREQNEGRWTRDYATTLSNLADYHDAIGDHDSAERLGMIALVIRDSVVSRQHPDFAESVGNLASYHYHAGNYQAAIIYGTNAVELNSTIYSTDNPLYAESLGRLTVYYDAAGIVDSADVYALRATRHFNDAILGTFADLTVSERNHYWHKVESWYMQTLPGITRHHPTPAMVENCYNAVLIAKGLLLNSEIEMQRLISESGDSALVARYHNLQMSHRQLLQQITLPASRRNFNIDSLALQIRREEHAILRRSKSYGDYTNRLAIDWRSVRDALRPGELAVEYICIDDEAADSTHYAVFTLKHDSPAPHFYVLTSNKQISAVRRREYYVGNQLSRQLLLPLAHVGELSDDVQTIYFSPSGQLYNIAVEALPLWNDLGYASDRWQMHRLSSTRWLAFRHVDEPSDHPFNHAGIYGGLTYGQASERTDVPYLPGTLAEVQAIGQQLDEAGIVAMSYTAGEGTEQAFRTMADRLHPDLLHIATHGFYWNEREATLNQKKRGMRFLATTTRGNMSPEESMLRGSGLMLTGANIAMSGTQLLSADNDGILTSREISRTDLRSVRLVVLSACQTGLGTITGDGVFGLQRGFKKAGCHSLLMSLWQVDDAATSLLMQDFYRHIIAGETPADAIRMARRTVREHAPDPSRPDYHPYASPHFWAAFILLD